MSIADLDTLYANYAAARAAGSYLSAIGWLMDMKARLAATPNLTRNLGGGGSQSIAWNATQLDSLIADCYRMQAAANAASGAIVLIPVTYARPSATGDYS